MSILRFSQLHYACVARATTIYNDLTRITIAPQSTYHLFLRGWNFGDYMGLPT